MRKKKREGKILWKYIGSARSKIIYRKYCEGHFICLEKKSEGDFIEISREIAHELSKAFVFAGSFENLKFIQLEMTEMTISHRTI